MFIDCSILQYKLERKRDWSDQKESNQLTARTLLAAEYRSIRCASDVRNLEFGEPRLGLLILLYRPSLGVTIQKFIS